MSRGRLVRPVASLSVLGIAACLACLRTYPPAAKPLDAPAGEFSAARAIQHLQQIARQPRLTGTPSYARSLEYLKGQLAAQGLACEVQRTQVPSQPWGDLAIENLLARMPGSATRDAILLVAHLDTTPNSPGAMDDGSGVAVLLEAVRALRSGPTLRNTIIVLLTSDEEKGGFGAHAFGEHPWARDVKLVIEADAGGVGGPSILAATGPYSGWLIRQYAVASPHPLGSSAIESLGSPYTDYTMSLRPRGFAGFSFALAWDKRVHSPFDSLANANPRSIQQQGDNVLAMARQFGNQRLVDPGEPRPIYFDYLGWIVVHYPSWWAIPLAVIASLVFGAVVVIGIARGLLSPAGTVLGTVMFLLGIVTASAAVEILVLVLVWSASSDYANHEINFEILYWLRWGAGCLAVGIVAACYAVLSRFRKVSPQDASIGAYAALSLAALAASLWFRDLSYVFSWPLLASLLAVGLWFSTATRDKPGPSTAAQVALLLASFVIVTMLLPSILVALQGLEIRELYLAAAFVVALVGFVLPQVGLALKQADPGSWF